MAQAKLCAIDGCGKRHKGHGFCEAHLARLKKNGSPHIVGRRGRLPGFASKRKIIINEDWLRKVYVGEGWHVSSVAKAAGCRIHTINLRLKEAGIPVRDGRKGRNGRKCACAPLAADVISLYVDKRMAINDVSSALGSGPRTIRKILVGAGIKIRHHNETKRGTKARNRIDLPVSEVVSCYTVGGNPVQEIARAYGVSSNVISRILNENGISRRPLGELVNRFGSNNPNWRPHLTDQDRDRRRDNFSTVKWRNAVFERDQFKCLRCEDAKGGNLVAHHIVAYAACPEKRWDVGNGATLCIKCHKAFHQAFGLRGFGVPEFMRFLERADDKPRLFERSGCMDERIAS